jgi:hypothetical protein
LLSAVIVLRRDSPIYRNTNLPGAGTLQPRFDRPPGNTDLH